MTFDVAISSSRTAAVTDGIDRDTKSAVPIITRKVNDVANARLESDFCKRPGTVALRVVALERFSAAFCANRAEPLAARRSATLANNQRTPTLEGRLMTSYSFPARA